MRTIKVNGMSCQHCAKAVTKALEEIQGVSGVSIDLSKGMVSFEEDHPVDMGTLQEKIKKAGYELG
jgi:copper chaperone